jgi:E3 ubiquitin-protein ligase NEDD4
MKYQRGNSSTILSHLTESISNSKELTKEQIEIIRKKYMPKYIFDWKIEKDEKTGRKFWKNQGKIMINDDIMNDIKKLLKKSIGSSEPFYKKRAWLFHYLSQNIEDLEKNSNLIIDKNNIFESSFIQFKKIKNLKQPIKVSFLGEEINDEEEEEAVKRIWYSKLFKDIFSKERKLFKENYSESFGTKTYIFYPQHSEMNMEHYEFVGKLLLKSFFDRVNIKDLILNDIILKPIIKRPITIEDLQYYDRNLYNSLKLINDSKIEGNKEFSKRNFTYKIKDENNNNEIKEIELIKNGKNIFLNDENKYQYIEKVISQEIIMPHVEQINSFQKGIFSIIDDNIRGIFSTDELNFLISGQNDIDIKDWKENTEYKGNYNENHKVIKMFWDKMKKLNKNELSKFLEFSTGLSNIPIDGFGSLKGIAGKIQKFTIEPYINYSSEDPSKYEFKEIEAKIYANRLNLPEYPNSQEMDKAFEIILNK